MLVEEQRHFFALSVIVIAQELSVMGEKMSK
jgi:hypothetical protein